MRNRAVVNEATSGSDAALLCDARAQLRAKDERIATLLRELAATTAATTAAAEQDAAVESLRLRAETADGSLARGGGIAINSGVRIPGSCLDMTKRARKR